MGEFELSPSFRFSPRRELICFAFSCCLVETGTARSISRSSQLWWLIPCVSSSLLFRSLRVVPSLTRRPSFLFLSQDVRSRLPFPYKHTRALTYFSLYLLAGITADEADDHRELVLFVSIPPSPLVHFPN